MAISSSYYSVILSAREIINSNIIKEGKRVLILLETEKQVKDCATWLNDLKCEKKIISLSPFATNELDQQKISFKIIEEYYNSRELYIFGMENFEKVENICNIIDSHIKRNNNIFKKLDISPALFNMYYIKMVYDITSIRLFQLSKLIDTENPDIIIIYKSEKYPFGTSNKAPNISFDDRESIYYNLLCLNGWNFQMVFLPSQEEPATFKTNHNTISNSLEKWVILNPKLFDIAMLVKKKKWGSICKRISFYAGINKSSPILLIGAGYNWDECLDELQSAGISPLLRMQEDLDKFMPPANEISDSIWQDLWKNISNNLEFKKFFKYNNIDYSSLLADRFLFLIRKLAPACLSCYFETAKVLESNKIKALIGSTFTTCLSHSSSKAANNLGVPVILWQHGAYGFNEWPLVKYVDLMGVDFRFVFGDGVTKWCQDDASFYKTQLISVGSSSLEALAKKKSSLVGLKTQGRVVLYASSAFHKNSFYVSFFPPFSDNMLWKIQKAIIEVLGKHENFSGLIKLHPSSNVDIFLYQNKPGNCTIITNEYSFADLLQLADIIIIDSPATALLQALTIRKPIFVYTGYISLYENAEILLKRRAYCYHDLDDFIEAINEYLLAGDVVKTVDLNDNSFLERYGTSSHNEGTAAERAAEMLRKIIDNYGKN